ncbi:putative HTH transcriptional regulator, partial [Flavobacterium sp. 28A]|uniref:AlbA family DNA-binding domain-containing protein n=1 Tax=Flavobacterium sp. 28A TaxID=2735895 RepID=UPI0015713EFA
MNSDYIEKIFGKSRNEVTLNDIKEYFSTEQEESSVIEFKSGEVEINDIFKEITAFLNTEGGLLVIGTPRETKKIIGKNNTIKVCEGELTYSNFKNKDW